MWFAVGAIAIGSTFVGIKEFKKDYWFLEIEMMNKPKNIPKS